jgi:hypothetical protein
MKGNKLKLKVNFNSEARNTNKRGRLSTLDLLIKVACFVKKINIMFNAQRLSKLGNKGGQWYSVFPFSKASMSNPPPPNFAARILFIISTILKN